MIVAYIRRWYFFQLHKLITLKLSHRIRLMALLMVHQRRLKFIVRWFTVCTGLWETRAEVDSGVQGALEGLRVVIEAHHGMVLVVSGH